MLSWYWTSWMMYEVDDTDWLKANSLTHTLFVFSRAVRAGGDQAAGEPAEDPRVCPRKGQPEAHADI